ncbi:UNVERIFIED_CONTAM: hypothetical protein Slati_3594200 [Sesamum latifolium]|uniref:Uncharacterized protein n=1 Tax=Sesamum latifolium TaxID=2727402 RepID=A0AAW2TYL3_9LAMI
MPSDGLEHVLCSANTYITALLQIQDFDNLIFHYTAYHLDLTLNNRLSEFPIAVTQQENIIPDF